MTSMYVMKIRSCPENLGYYRISIYSTPALKDWLKGCSFIN